MTIRNKYNERKVFWLNEIKITALLTPALLVMIALYIIPFCVFFRYGFGDQLSLNTLSEVFTSSLYQRVFFETVFFCLLATGITMLIGIPVAYFLVYSSKRWRGLVYFSILIPIIVNPLSTIYGWIHLLSRFGWINSLFSTLIGEEISENLLYSPGAVLIGIIYIGLPFMVFSIMSSMNGIDLSLIQASMISGASNLQIFRYLILPLSKQGIIAGCILTFIISMGYFIIPVLLGGGHVTFISVLIEQQINEVLNWDIAAAISIWVMLLVIILLIVSQLFFKWTNIKESASK